MKSPLLALPILAISTLPSFSQRHDPVCLDPNANTTDIVVNLSWHDKNCLVFDAGFNNTAGNFVSSSYSRTNLLHLDETLALTAEIGVRLRSIQFTIDKPTLLGKPIETGFTVRGQRFGFNEARESSIFAFQRDIPLFSSLPRDDLLNFVSHGVGVTGFAQYRFSDTFSRIGLTYSYDVSSYQALTEATLEYFGFLVYKSAISGDPFAFAIHRFSGIRRSRLTPSFSYNTIDHPDNPTRGVAFSAALGATGFGGDVNTLEPAVEMKYFRSGIRKSHVIGLHVLGRLITGWGFGPPPFDRYYSGGEDSIRGFDSWSISPIAYMPSSAAVNVLNNDGSPRVLKTIVNGVLVFTNLTMQIPVYRPLSIGGDTNVVMNFEYRIPLRSPFTLALFADAGVNRATFQQKLRLYDSRIEELNAEFPQSGFIAHMPIERETQKIRVSLGPELQLMAPKINAPIRFYVAYNPAAERALLQIPPSFDRSYFPNTATYTNAMNTLGVPIPYQERRFMFRFSVGRTF